MPALVVSCSAGPEWIAAQKAGGHEFMWRIARVLVDVPGGREFDYIIPPAWQEALKIGTRVEVPLGRRRVFGYVVGFSDRSEHQNLRPLGDIVGPVGLLDVRLLDLARWIADYYCATLEEAVRAILPTAVRRYGFRQKEQLTVFPGEVLESGSVFHRLSPGQRRVIEYLRTEGPVSLAQLTRTLGISQAPIKSLARQGILRLAPAPVLRTPLANRKILPTQPLPLTTEQAVVLEQVKTIINRQLTGRNDSGAARKPEPHVVLLFGVTGSGKTEVYLQAIAHVLDLGCGAIVLVPEIALTPQTLERFCGRFGHRVAVLHSRLSDGERHDEWHRIRSGEASVVVGARSAVFAPIPRLGLIVVDEEHEPSYKQEEVPRYNARDVAVMRGYLEGCAVLLGSATPSLESWANVRAGKYCLGRLTQRADQKRMPVIRVVDMRVEAQRTGSLSVFSRELLEAIRERLTRKEQTILFLNRRGFATALICPVCGYVATCSLCSVSCTYHRKEDRLRCHICGETYERPASCPSCHDPSFRFTGIGTERIERIVEKLLPAARVQRMDTDVTTRKDAHERILGEFRSGRIDILIGTQMIAKGLHFPNVTLVGIIYADLSLHMPDFRAGERTFQLLAQVAGRSGRGDVCGEVIVPVSYT
ncbi:MAG: primosomal protein N', partial [Kiritimatiellae bacterium]|nr:primosomal protein N' [Kiritimatiellia bacterium]